MKWAEKKLKVGDWVEVRSKDEILATLDGNSHLDGMPFMPEMFAFCGKRFQVYKRAHKTCDTVFPVRGRRVADAVHLETRCDGSAHGGCQASCLLFWKMAWLKPVAAKVDASNLDGSEETVSQPGGCTEADVVAQSEVLDPKDGAPKYVCQATQLPYASSQLDWWDSSQYLEDYRSGNVSLWQVFCGGLYFFSYWLSRAGIGVGRPIRWFWDKFYPWWGGSPFPRKTGTISDGEPTPVKTLNLQPGELVRIKSQEEILQTLNSTNRNRGLYFDAEEVPYCGKTYRVLKHVTRIVNERTGKMQEMKTPCVILDSVICQSRYSECRLFCPRSIYPYWREIWLDRVEASPSEASAENAAMETEKEKQVVKQC
jgi:hypothetical protein